jgi:hypothetical protein
MSGNNKSGRNKDLIFRALKIINLFSHRNMTTKQVASELGITKQAAGKWITGVSLVLPLAEVGTIREGQGGGSESIIYGLMK